MVKTHTFELTDREVLCLRAAALRAADDYDRYVQWVDDRPMLPERELAIARIKNEVREYRELAVKLFVV